MSKSTYLSYCNIIRHYVTFAQGIAAKILLAWGGGWEKIEVLRQAQDKLKARPEGMRPN